MAKICAAFFNALYDETDEERIPCWYETFFKGLRERGNELLLFPVKEFQKEYGEIDDMTKQKIIEFAPDLYISFNNVFFDMPFLECPQIVYEADTPIYWNGKDKLKNNKTKLFAVFGEDEVQYLNEKLGISRNRIFKVIPFTEVCAENKEQNINISFIGSRFGVCRQNEMGYLSEMDSGARKEYYDCLEYIINHPLVDKEELIKKNDVKNKKVIDVLDLPGMLNMMSSEKRIRVLSAIVDLGLNLYGTDSWMYRYHFDSRLNLAYVNQSVFSLQHNQDIYNSSKLSINISHYQAKDCFSWRVLDIMASNACLVTDAWSGVKKFFPEITLPIYKDEHQARDMCLKLLHDEILRTDIVGQCHEVVEKRYRFKNHLSQLEEITGICLSCTVAKK